jgi:signal transduction histidine kinase
MTPTRPGQFFRTTAFRLAIVYIGLFVASVAVLFAFVYATTGALLDRQREQAIIDDMAGLSDVFATGGFVALGDAILARTQPDRVGDKMYLLTDAAFEPQAGNVVGWPPKYEADGQWLSFTIERTLLGDPESHRAVALHVELPDGYHLLVGQDTRTEERFLDAILEVFLWALAVTLVLGIGGGLFMSRNMLRRIEAINEGAEHVMHGEFKHRMPVSGSGDEFDRLAINLNAMLDEIERLMASVRQVTINIAHDLRSPLTRMKQRLEEALSERADAEKRHEAVEQAVAETDELLATFNAMLSIADAESGAGRTEMAPVDLEALVADVAELYEPLVEEQGLAFETEIRGPATVTGNRHLLFQAIANLVDNAVKYGASGGRIRMALRPDGPLGGPELVVADSGPGIPATDRERVLDRFVRLDASRTTPGNGLGLSLVAAIVRLHGARLELEDNEPGLRISMRFRAATPAGLSPGQEGGFAMAGDSGGRSRSVTA